MREARYPLAAARTQREVALQQAEQTLLAARASLRDVEKAADLAAHAAAEHARLRVRAVTPEPTSGVAQLSGQQIALSGLYAARLHQDAGRLAERRSAAQLTVAEQARAVRLAELAWLRAHAEREAIERHHERFRAAERKAAERAYELEAEERAHTTRVRETQTQTQARAPAR
jgi:hypothetical protein